MSQTTWAGRAATPPEHHEDPRRPSWVPAVGIAAVLGLVGVGGYLLGSIDDSDSITAGPTTEITAESTGPSTSADEVDATDADQDATDEPSSTTAPPTTAATTTAPTTTTPATTAPTSTTAAPPDDELITVDEGETRAAVLRGGTLYLGGAVPNRDVADQIIERAAAVIGAENIVDQYVIDPEAPVDPGAPLYVEDVVLFAYGSPTFDPQFAPLLDLGLLLLSQNPSVTLTVVTHTDSSGTASYNQQLSVRRGESVAQYWIDRGIPAEQIVIDARGERDPVADNNDPAGAQLNRRAEFYVEGLLG